MSLFVTELHNISDGGQKTRKQFTSSKGKIASLLKKNSIGVLDQPGLPLTLLPSKLVLFTPRIPCVSLDELLEFVLGSIQAALIPMRGKFGKYCPTQDSRSRRIRLNLAESMTISSFLSSDK